MGTLNELAQTFLAWSAKVNRPRTVDAYRHQLKKFCVRFGAMPVEELRSIHLVEVGKSWHLVQAVQRLFNWAKDEAEIVERNPFKRVRKPPIGERKRLVSPIESARMLRRSRRNFRTLLLGYRETFSRPQELRFARLEELQATDRRTTIEQALKTGRAIIVQREYKSRRMRRESNKPRVILLSPRACRLILRLWQRSKTKRGWIFTNSRGKQWSANAVRCAMRRLRKRLKMRRDRHGENVVPYTFRHSGATEAAASGIRDRVLAELLGHASTRTTARYQHLHVDHLQRAMADFWRK